QQLVFGKGLFHRQLARLVENDADWTAMRGEQHQDDALTEIGILQLWRRDEQDGRAGSLLGAQQTGRREQVAEQQKEPASCHSPEGNTGQVRACATVAVLTEGATPTTASMQCASRDLISAFP